MKTFTCDICGKEIPLEDRMRAEKSLDIQKMIGNRMDICPRCRLVGAALDPVAILKETWRSQVLPAQQVLKAG